MLKAKIDSIRGNKLLWVSVACFLLLGIAFQMHTLGPLVIPAMSGMWWVFQQYRTANFRKILWFSSLIYFGLSWSWLLFMDPSGWSPLTGITAKLFVIFVWLIVTLIMSVPFYYMIKLWSYTRTKSKSSYIHSILLFIGLWILQELARSYFFAFVMWGGGSSLEPHWNFGVLGIAITSIPSVPPLSSTIGMYGLTSIAILIGITIHSLLSKNTHAVKLLSVVVVIFIAGHSLNAAYNNPAGESISITAINTSSSVINYTMYESPNSSSNLILLPEYSDIFDNRKNTEYASERDDFLKATTVNNSLVITSRETKSADNEAQNDLVYFTANGEIISEQHKTFLIPGGEYLPYWFEVFYSKISPSGLQEYNLSRKVVPGNFAESPTDTEFGAIGSYACSGVISPKLYRSMANQGAQVLTNSASLTIFDGAETYHQQTEGFSIFHAASNQKSFIQSTKMGKAYVINADGKIQQRSGTAEDKLLHADVELSNSKTAYTRFGELTIYFAGIYIIWTYVKVGRTVAPKVKKGGRK
ncbi:MAG: apolipoprotein N-acyltransferase [Candidatus Saccharimonadales bacterium]|jgi:apolipoprotein N-acyltransferase